MVDVIAGCQEELVALAGGVRFERFARDVAALADLADQDGGHDPRPEDNRLSVADGPEGSLVLKGTFVGDLAACLRHALEARADKLFRAHREDRRQCPELAAPTRGQLLAEALAELVRAGHAAGGSRAPVVDVTLVLPATAVPPPDGVGSGTGAGAGGSVLGTQVGRCTDVAGLRYSTHTVKLLCCDARFHPLAVSAAGVPLDLGSTVRLANRHQRRAASVRDGGCVFPGCDAPPSWTDLHHVIHAGPDGPTDMWNLASLCRRHHGIVHRRGWSMTADGEQWFTFTTPAGTTVGSQRHGRQRDRQPSPR